MCILNYASPVAKVLTLRGHRIIIGNVSTKRLYKSNMRRYCSIRVRLIRLFPSVNETDIHSMLSIHK